MQSPHDQNHPPPGGPLPPLYKACDDLRRHGVQTKVFPERGLLLPLDRAQDLILLLNTLQGAR